MPERSLVTLILLLVGLIVGIASGIIGIGGGIFFIPILVFFFHMDQHKAQGTSLAALLLPVGIFAFWTYYRDGNADLKVGLLLAAGFTVGGLAGGWIAQTIPDFALRRVFAIILIALGVKMLLQR